MFKIIYYEILIEYLVKFIVNKHGKFNNSLKSFIDISNEYINIQDIM